MPVRIMHLHDAVVRHQAQVPPKRRARQPTAFPELGQGALPCFPDELEKALTSRMRHGSPLFVVLWAPLFCTHLILNTSRRAIRRPGYFGFLEVPSPAMALGRPGSLPAAFWVQGTYTANLVASGFGQERCTNHARYKATRPTESESALERSHPAHWPPGFVGRGPNVQVHIRGPNTAHSGLCCDSARSIIEADMRLLRALFALVIMAAALLLVGLAAYVAYVAYVAHLWTEAREEGKGSSMRQGHLPGV